MSQGTKRKRRSRRSPEQWAEIVEGWRASGQTAEEYAEEHNLGVDNLWRWSARARGRVDVRRPSGKMRPAVRPAPPRFLAVQVTQPTARRSEKGESEPRQGVEIAWPRGPIVRLSGEVSEERLSAVMRALAEVVPC